MCSDTTETQLTTETMHGTLYKLLFDRELLNIENANFVTAVK